MLSYRYYETYGQTQAEKNNDKVDEYRASTYQRYQGQKLANRFNAFTYYGLSKMMDSHNVGRNRESIESALKSIKARTLVVGIDSDILFPLHEQRYLAETIPNSRLELMSSLYGHDGFLVEFEQLSNHIRNFFREDLVSVEIKSLLNKIN